MRWGNWDFSRVDVMGDAPAGWSLLTGTYNITTLAGSARAGPGALKFGNVSSNGELQGGIVSDLFEPIDPTKTYSMEAYVETLNEATGLTFYAGLRCYNAVKDLIPTYYNRYFCANGVSMSTAYPRLMAGVISAVSPTPAFNQFPSGTVYVKRVLYFTVTAGSALFELSYCHLREIAESPLLACRDFGMVPGGVADWNADALETMLNHLAAYGGHGYIEMAGTYTLNRQIEINGPGSGKGFTLSGLGRHTTLQPSVGIGHQMIEINNTNYVRITDLTLDMRAGDSESQRGGGFAAGFVNCDYCAFERIWVFNPTLVAGGLRMDTCDYGLMQDCHVEAPAQSDYTKGVALGYLLTSNKYTVVNRCKAINIIGYTETVEGVLVTEGLGYGIEFKSGCIGSRITNCTTINCQWGIVNQGGGDSGTGVTSGCDISSNIIYGGAQSDVGLRLSEGDRCQMHDNVIMCQGHTMAAVSMRSCTKCSVSFEAYDFASSGTQTDRNNGQRVLYLTYNESAPASAPEPCKDNIIDIRVMHGSGVGGGQKPICFDRYAERNRVIVGNIPDRNVAPWDDIKSTFAYDASTTPTYNTLTFA